MNRRTSNSNSNSSTRGNGGRGSSGEQHSNGNMRGLPLRTNAANANATTAQRRNSSSTSARAIDPTSALNALAAEVTTRAVASAATTTAASTGIANDPLRHEELFDLHNRSQYPGPDDSEDDDDDCFETDILDRLQHEDDNMVAFREEEYIKSSNAMPRLDLPRRGIALDDSIYSSNWLVTSCCPR
jgi:hypothetical protein